MCYSYRGATLYFKSWFLCQHSSSDAKNVHSCGNGGELRSYGYSAANFMQKKCAPAAESADLMRSGYSAGQFNAQQWVFYSSAG